MTKRWDYMRRTDTSFKKTYGKWVYHFNHHKVEIPGYTSVTITVHRANKGSSTLRVGELVHFFQFSKEDD